MEEDPANQKNPAAGGDVRDASSTHFPIPGSTAMAVLGLQVFSLKMTILIVLMNFSSCNRYGFLRIWQVVRRWQQMCPQPHLVHELPV